MVETSRSHSDTPHSVGLLRTSDQPDLTTHNTHKRQTFLPPAGFEPTIPASERPQTHALDGAATGIAVCQYSDDNFVFQSDSTVTQRSSAMTAGSTILRTRTGARSVSKQAFIRSVLRIGKSYVFCLAEERRGRDDNLQCS
jgi:hypothetical protein